ncbi:hypothetical protein BC827DRAFT_132362 [Russula dissimulans]|nr:hypothetical protein BC827DRAFT_132362 [Russula dissimulans]
MMLRPRPPSIVMASICCHAAVPTALVAQSKAPRTAYMSSTSIRCCYEKRPNTHPLYPTPFLLSPIPMVNLHDPGVVIMDDLALLKLWHCTAAIYLWEFVTSLDFEWDVIRGHIRPKRTIWVCLLLCACGGPRVCYRYPRSSERHVSNGLSGLGLVPNDPLLHGPLRRLPLDVTPRCRRLERQWSCFDACSRRMGDQRCIPHLGISRVTKQTIQSIKEVLG